MSSSQRGQAALFEGPDASALVAVRGPKATLGKAQQTFNRLTEQVRRQREVLAQWEAYATRFLQRVAAELEPVERRVREAQRRLVLRMDELLSRPIKGERLSRKHRAALCTHIEAVLEELLADGADAELEALLERHGGMTRDERRKLEMELAQDVMRNLFGAEAVAGHQTGDVESLMEHVREKVAAQSEARERKREEREAAATAKRRRPTKAEQAAQRKAQAARDAGRAVQEVYRKLASALHPDREPDEEQRRHKTLLMQRVNQAYGRSDLLELLGLQIEIEQIDADHLADVPEARMRHYNDVLREQVQAVQAQAFQCAAPILFELGLPPQMTEPLVADAALTRRIAEARRALRDIEHDLRALDDPRARRALLDSLLQQGGDFQSIDAVLDELMGDFVAATMAPRPARPEKKRRG